MGDEGAVGVGQHKASWPGRVEAQRRLAHAVVGKLDQAPHLRIVHVPARTRTGTTSQREKEKETQGKNKKKKKKKVRHNGS